MGWVDQVPRAGNLYIGGLHALYQKPDLFDQAKITHVLSVLDFDIYEQGYLKDKYKSLMIRLDDDPRENILKHFRDTNAFIDSALRGGGAVFVHCAMGKSRSATVVCAYLMWRYNMSPGDALAQLCEGRPVCSPNPGFMEQLETYHMMLQAKDDTKADGIYKDWLANQFQGESWAWEKQRGPTAKL